MRFWSKRIALIADIEKAFLQVGLNEADRDVTRFPWVKDIKKPPMDTNLQVYRLTRIPFGIISSPSLLGSTVKHLLESIGAPVTEQAVHDIYIDNLISGVNITDEAIQFYKEIKQSFKEASMNLRDWGSNSTDFLKTAPADDCNQQVISKVLGILWEMKQDNLMIRSPNHEVLINAKKKREVLAVIASVYDPLGYLSSAMTKMNVFLQRLWEEGKDLNHEMT